MSKPRTEPRAESQTITLLVRRTIRASPERLFEAWTRPEHLTRWWGPGPMTCPTAEVDLTVGGRYRLANLAPDGSTMWIAGRFIEIEPPTKLVYSWGLEPNPDDERVTVRFSAAGDATEVVIQHERLTSEASRDQHEQGWNGCLDGLVELMARAG